MERESMMDLVVITYGLVVVNSYNKIIRGKNEASHMTDPYIERALAIAKREGCLNEFDQTYKDFSTAVLMENERRMKEMGERK